MMSATVAVANDPETPVGAQDWLVSASHIDDAETAHTETEIAVDQCAGVVRASMDKPLALTRNDSLVDRPSPPSVPTSNSAHSGRAFVP